MLFLSLCLVLTYGSTSSTLNRPDQFSKLTILGGGPATADSVAPCDRSIDPERTTTTFVGIENGHFILNGRFRFMGANNVYLHYEPKPMVDDVIEDAAKMNLTVLRCWGFLDGQPRPDGTVLQPEPGVYNESGFGKLDYAIEKAKEEGIRLVIVLINNWADFGGMPQYIEWVKSETGNLTLLHDDFYTNERCQQIYKDYVMYVLNRNNTYTGLKYKDDPTIMAWELANEPRCDSDKSGNTLVDWAQEMSDYIKSIDPNHLLAVGDGGFLNRPNVTAYRYDGSNGVDWERLIKLPNIDYGTFHLYPEYWGKNWSDTLQAGLEWIKVHCDLAKEANIPVVLEEYGVSARSGKNRNMIYEYWNEALYENDADGSMFWILTGIDTVQARADNGTGLYPDVSGFRVVEGSDTAQLISEYAQLMAGELNETDLPPRIYLINPYEEEEIAGNYQVNTTVFPRGKEVQEVTFNSSLSNQTVTLNFTFIGISMKYTYAGIWNTSEEPNNQKVEGIARVTFTDGYSASTSVNVTIANGPVQYVIREQFTFDNDLEGFSNASTYHAEYGSPPIQHSDFNGGSLQANIKWFGDKA